MCECQDYSLGIDLEEPSLFVERAMSARRNRGDVYMKRIRFFLFVLAKVDGDSFVVELWVDGFQLFAEDRDGLAIGCSCSMGIELRLVYEIGGSLPAAIGHTHSKLD